MTSVWVDFDTAAVSRQYDRIAGLIVFFEWLLFLPRGLRGKTVDRMDLRPGGRVLEVGCGTGRNFPFLCNAVGPTGRVYGVDLSAGMLSKIDGLSRRHGWTNVRLTQGDAADYTAPEPLDGVLFSLALNTMPHHSDVLRRAWAQLKSGGRLVIMDAKVPNGWLGRLFLPLSLWLMKRTLLGNPFVRPWDSLQQVAGTYELEEFLFGSYYICRAIKP
jgi:ubiquinone/menaquinone biosynthesis C-methylase UbiE